MSLGGVPRAVIGPRSDSDALREFGDASPNASSGPGAGVAPAALRHGLQDLDQRGGWRVGLVGRRT